MKDVNRLYSKIGFQVKITTKSAKVLGTSLAFSLGMSNDHVMLLGRWKDPATAQYYRSVDPSTLLKVYGTLSLNPSFLDSESSGGSISTQHPPQPVTQKSPRNLSPSAGSRTTSMTMYAGSSHQELNHTSDIFPSHFSSSVRHFLLSTIYLQKDNNPLANDGFPLPPINPEVLLNGEQNLCHEESHTFVVKYSN